MRRICAWCNKVLSDDGGPVTHTICNECSKALFDLKHAEPQGSEVIHAG